MSAVALSYSPRGKLNYAGAPGAGQNQKRDELVLAHAEMVRRVGFHLADRLDGSVDPDDLVQTGMVGLLEAAERYSPVEGIPFEAYALPRVRGAMLDGLRRNDWCPRAVRRQARQIREARERLSQSLARSPSEAELSEATGLSIEECRKTEMSADRANVASIEALLESGEALMPAGPDRASQPIVRKKLQKSLAQALKQLPEREQIIMSLYYDEELNQKEIARVMELTEARISQLRSKAIKTLRRKMLEWM